MFIQEQFQTLFAYHWHTTYRLMDCAAKLEEVAYRESGGYGHGSIHDLLFHLLRTNNSWRVALQTGQQQTGMQLADFSTLAAVRAGMKAEQASWETFLQSLSTEEMEGNVSLINWRGDPFVIPCWRVLQHLLFHGMQHHSELAGLLIMKGESPGNLDFIFFT